MAEHLTKEPINAWLIENEADPVQYYCGPGEWCTNPNHALKFPTREAAELRMAALSTMSKLRVTGHQWG
jgi:hypothetical protein